jgi:plasmid stability protein
MAQILVENLDPVILEKLATLAQQHGRSLQEELKHILEQAAETATYYHTGGDMEQTREAAARAQVRYAGKFFSDSAELIREDRER